MGITVQDEIAVHSPGPEEARFQHLLNLPESENMGQAVTDAMKAIEAENTQLDGVLPRPITVSKRTP